MRLRSWFILVAALCLCAVPASFAKFTNGAVASADPLATRAGVEVLKSGGNAVDAAVAVALTLGVVEGYNSGVGGGCFVLICKPDGCILAIDGRETAPAKAHSGMFVRNGKPDSTLSQTGPLASGVPGALAAYALALKECGTRPLADLLRPAADLAEAGFAINARYASRIEECASDLARFEASGAIFLTRNGLAPSNGYVLCQPELAASYRAIAQQGIEWFYQGAFAEAVETWMSRHGGVMTAEDFRKYQPRMRAPIHATYRGFEVIGFPPPSSGGVHLVQMLQMTERFPMAQLSEVDRAHIMAEAMKLAFADRAHWLGDPDFAKVPRGLVAGEYAAWLASRIDLKRAAQGLSHGTPPRHESELFERHTTHFSVADARGYWVAVTATLNTSFGSKVVIPGTGIMMNNEMDDFSAQPGAANYFGLVGGEANAVAPGKRPLSSMTPTLVRRDGHPVIALGASGGPKIITAVFTELIGMLDFGMTPEQALKQPRIHHQWTPDVLMVEKTVPRKLRSALTKRGHKLKEFSSGALSQIVARSSSGSFIGGTDPRGGGQAAVW